MEPTNETTILDSWNGLGYPQVAELIRTAFRDVYNRLGTGSYIEKTWGELKALRDEAGLSPGTYYRITDYVATTTQQGTRSASHPFDIIVFATGVDTLSEDALAIQHQGDTHFQHSDLAAWRLSYCLDNDTKRFLWADAEGGKGVVYRLVDEQGNDLPYDFKGIQFKRLAITGFSQSFKGNDDIQSVLLFDPDENPLYYGATDAYGNDVPQYAETEGEEAWFYTFTGVDKSSSLDSPEYYDMSTINKELSEETIQACIEDGCGTDTKDRVHGNVIKPAREEYMEDDTYYRGRQVLNNIVFYGRHYDNGYDDGYEVAVCHSNTFDAECRDCTFGNNCWYNTFGNGCNNNTFGNDCYSNTFGNSCNNNTFGNSCGGNTFGNYCQSNTFGNGCSSNTFGNGCQSNIFGNWFQNNTFGNSCSRNTFGNDCSSNTFGNNFQYGTVFEGVTLVNIPGSSSVIKYCTILAGTQGTNGNNKLTINFVANKTTPQFAGKNTAGTLKIWNPADMVD